MSQKFSFPSPAKLNLFLHVVGRRADGYHELETVFQFIDQNDTIDIQITNDSNITLLTPIEGVDYDDNLIVKAAKILQQKTQTPQGAKISIIKCLPMGGGLGGGSSNAATILLALNKLWNVNFSTQKLAGLGVKLGADVPIFVHGFAAFAQGIGEQLTPVYPKEYWYLVSKPSCSISTQSVFSSPDLIRNTPKLSLDDFDIESGHNDCQTIVIKHYPKVAKLLAWLIEYAPSRMTGTGACIFTCFDTEKEACCVQSKLPKGIDSFVAKGLNESPMVAAITAIDNK